MGSSPWKQLRFHAVAHADQVSHGQALFALIQVGDGPAREEGHHRLVELEFALPGGDADQGGRNALGHGGQIVRERSIVGLEVGVQHHVAVADDHQAVDGDVLVMDGLELLQQAGRS